MVSNLIPLINHQSNKSYTDFPLPDISSDLLRHYIRGYFEGDGWITYTYKNGKLLRKRFGILAQPIMAYQLKNLFSTELDIDVNPHHINRNKPNNGLHSLYINKNNDLIKMYHYLYQDANFVMKRKHDKFKEIMIILRDEKGCDVGDLYSFDEQFGRLEGGENPAELSPKSDAVDEFTKENFDSTVTSHTSIYGKYL